MGGYHDPDSGLDFASYEEYREAREGPQEEHPPRHPATALTWAWLEQQRVHGMKPERAARIEDVLRSVDADLLTWDRQAGFDGCVCPGPDTCAGPPCSSARPRW